MGNTGIILDGMPEELMYISLTENFPHLGIAPWQWEEVGFRWITFLQLWAGVQEDAKSLHRQLFDR